jgi:predicted ATPase/DNA-binding winged helix-turn-helix (wHTH) protein
LFTGIAWPVFAPPQDHAAAKALASARGIGLRSHAGCIWPRRVKLVKEGVNGGCAMDEPAISFGPFRLIEARRLLLEGDKPVRLGGRAFDILAALVDHAGEVVTKEALMARVWPQTFVEEANLKIQVSALRRALGDGQGAHRYILTVPGRGYNFVAPVRLAETPLPTRPLELVPAKRNNLPLAVIRVVGRDDVVATILARLSRQRLVTIAGPGGIGKTTVALAVAERLIADYEHGVWMVDLAPLADARFVPSAVATALGVELHTEDPLPGLVAALKDRRALLLLDNCEHVVDAAAGLAAAVLGGVPGVNILATSREPLGVNGERVHRLEPLDSPEPSPGLTAAEAMAFPAVQLFVERVTAIVEDFALTDANASLVVEICRRLDGLPLAIEFAAPRVEVLGVEGLAAGLDDSPRLLRTQRRAAMPRHRTMQAVVDWSYGLLGEDEQRFLRALGIFAGGFACEAAAAVAIDAAASDGDAIDRLADLVAKSLVVADVGDTKPRFRLLDTTRAFALEKLDENGERETIARRHAEYFRDLFWHAEGLAVARPPGGWLAAAAREIDNVRAALDWAFSSSGHAAIGTELTAGYEPVWLNLSLTAECRERCEHALRMLRTEPNPDARLQMRLRIGLGNSLLHTFGPAEQARSVLTEALAIADTLGDLPAQLRVLLGLSSVHGYRGEYALAAAEIERAALIAHQVGDARSVVAAQRRMGINLLTIGRLGEAQRWFERAIRAAFHLEEDRLPVTRHQRDRAMAQASLARVLWLRGFPDRARLEAQASIDDARGRDHQLTMCRVLYFGIGRIAPMTGEFGAADDAITTLIDLASRINARFWMTAGQFLRGKLLVQRHSYADGLTVLNGAFEVCRQTGWRLSYPEFTGSLAEALAGLRRADEAHDAIVRAIESAGGRADGQQWYVPELLRIKGEILLQLGAERTKEAANCFARAAAMAREQGALTWELRIGLSLCRLRMTQGQGDKGRRELAALYDRFTEGFGTADLIAARQLLDTPDNAGDG